MALSQDLLSILVCPENKTPLHPADPGLIAEINQRIADRALKNRGGETVQEQIEGGLIREDEKYLYVIREDIPVMLIEEAIDLSSIRGS